jgi:hypothetical protein
VTGAAVSGDMGWVSGNYTVVDAKGTVLDRGNYLSVHHRTNGQWLYIATCGIRIAARFSARSGAEEVRQIEAIKAQKTSTTMKNTLI